MWVKNLKKYIFFLRVIDFRKNKADKIRSVCHQVPVAAALNAVAFSANRIKVNQMAREGLSFNLMGIGVVVIRR